MTSSEGWEIHSVSWRLLDILVLTADFLFIVIVLFKVLVKQHCLTFLLEDCPQKMVKYFSMEQK